MTDALLQSQLDPAQSIKFALKIIGRRMQLEEDVTIPSSGFLDLRRLPAPVTTTIMRMAGNILEDEIKQQSSVNSMKPFEWYDYMKDCVFILFAETNVIAPLPVRLLLFSMLTQKVLYASLFEILSSRAPDVSAILHIIRRLQGALDKLKGDHMLPVLHTLVLQYYKPGSDVDYHTFIDVLKNDPRVPLDHVRFLLEFVVNSLTNEMAIQAEQIRWSQPNRLDQVALIIELSPTGRDTGSSFVLTMQWDSTETRTRILYGRSHKTYSSRPSSHPMKQNVAQYWKI
ncbi:hypothetical protein BC835DRAFT_1336316 [Cytidiella melzeri]|nr:hypothetical protein BC835DRAFT_1336316 [Cytidiella melzeri]